MILLLSLRATATGLNLTMANNVFIVDPWWNVLFSFIYSLQLRIKLLVEQTELDKKVKWTFIDLFVEIQ